MLGVLEVINNKHGQPFSQLQIEACTRISKTVATALQRPRQSGSASLMATTQKHHQPQALLQNLLQHKQLLSVLVNPVNMMVWLTLVPSAKLVTGLLSQAWRQRWHH